MKSNLISIRRRCGKTLCRVARLIRCCDGRFPYNMLSFLDYYGTMKISRFWPSLIHLPNGFKVILPKGYVIGFLGSVDDVYVNREYELLHDYRPSVGDVVFDVGAFIGLYTLKCIALVGEEGKVYAIEPLPQSYNILLNNVRINNLNNVIPINVALMDSEDSFYIYSCDRFPPASSIYEKHVEATTSKITSKFMVNTTTLDNLVSQFNIHNIDLLKIDVEGAELDVLKGGVNALDKGIVERIVVEIHEFDVNLENVSAFIQDRSYSIEGVFAFPYPKKMLYAKLKR